TVSCCLSSTPMICAARIARSCSRSESGRPRSRNTLPLPRMTALSPLIQHLLQSLQALTDQIDFSCWRLDPRPRLLLKRVDHPNVRIDVQRINDPIRIPSMPQSQLHHTRAETGERLGDIGHLAFRKDSQRPCHIDSRTLREGLKLLPGSLDPANGASISHASLRCQI